MRVATCGMALPCARGLVYVHWHHQLHYHAISLLRFVRRGDTTSSASLSSASLMKTTSVCPHATSMCGMFVPEHFGPPPLPLLLPPHALKEFKA
jgi:hypothetical protein